MKHDLTNKIFGKLTVLYKSDVKLGKEYPWLCECECGVFIGVRACHLMSGSIKSCGCSKNADLSPNAAFKVLFSRYKSVATKRKLSFTLSEETFKNIVTQSCFYCNDEPTQETIRESKRGVSRFIYNGIDRKNSEAGYTKGNCVPCCGICNRAKYDMSHTDFINWLNRVTNIRRMT